MPNASWGDLGPRRKSASSPSTAKPARLSGGETVGPNLYGTYYSNPVVAVINGQRLIIAGGGDGAIHAFKLRTGEVVWSKPFGKGVINGSPIVEGNLVYCTTAKRTPKAGRSAASFAWTPRRSIPRRRSRSLFGTATSDRTRRTAISRWRSDSAWLRPARGRTALLPVRHRRTLLLPRQGRRDALEVSLRDRSSRVAARR